ncbi:MAG TPA: hypothetical protein VLC10_05135 [Patescibacteria group bacterium]|nr:hypothetical protein [Patescibacteria group bacterium]
MKTSEYCPFCRLVVAPADPHRLVRNRQAAHEGCVRGKSMPSALAEFRRFLTARSDAAFEASVFEIKLKTTAGAKQLAQLMEWTLGKLLAKGADAQETAAIAALAARMADKLYVDIEVDAPAQAPRSNGSSKANRA